MCTTHIDTEKKRISLERVIIEGGRCFLEFNRYKYEWHRLSNRAFNKSVERHETKRKGVLYSSSLAGQYPGRVETRAESPLLSSSRGILVETGRVGASTGVKGVSGCIQKREKRLERVARRG